MIVDRAVLEVPFLSRAPFAFTFSVVSVARFTAQALPTGRSPVIPSLSVAMKRFQRQVLVAALTLPANVGVQPPAAFVGIGALRVIMAFSAGRWAVVLHLAFRAGVNRERFQR